MQPSEGEWLDRARRLDEKTLADIYDVLSPGLYRYAYRLLGDVQAAEDVVSETFHRFLIALRSGAGPRQHLRAYLYRVAHNLAIDHHRRQRLQLVALDGKLPAGEDDPESSSDQVVAAEQARRALWLLTPDQRLVVLLKFFEGLDNKEVAAALGKPEGAVKSLQHRALQALRRILDKGVSHYSEHA